MMDLAECHFQDGEASWMLRLEREDKKPENFEKLRQVMVSEFVPPNEMVAARVKLIEFMLKDGCQ